MSDIFREVDEDLRKERYSNLWKKYGWVVIALALLIVAVTAGYRGYQYFEERASAEAGARFQGAQNLFADGEREEALSVLASIAADGSSAYEDLAKFQLAGLADNLPAEERARMFLSLAEDQSLPSAARDLARVRAGYILLDTASREDVVSALEPINSDDNAFRSSVREILALAAYKAGDREAALDLFTQILSDGAAPRTITSRAEAYLDVIAGHEANVLTLPAEAEPAPEVSPVPAPAMEGQLEVTPSVPQTPEAPNQGATQ